MRNVWDLFSVKKSSELNNIFTGEKKLKKIEIFKMNI